jgi:hypothetical protein
MRLFNPTHTQPNEPHHEVIPLPIILYKAKYFNRELLFESLCIHYIPEVLEMQIVQNIEYIVGRSIALGSR